MRSRVGCAGSPNVSTCSSTSPLRARVMRRRYRTVQFPRDATMLVDHRADEEVQRDREPELHPPEHRCHHRAGRRGSRGGHVGVDRRAARRDVRAHGRLRPGLLPSSPASRSAAGGRRASRFDEAAALAGRKAIDASGVDPSRIGMMISTSVSRHHLEPSVACAIHHHLDLPTSCTNFDLANACLGFVNAMHLAATAIDAGLHRVRADRRRRGQPLHAADHDRAAAASRPPRRSTCSTSSPR